MTLLPQLNFPVCHCSFWCRMLSWMPYCHTKGQRFNIHPGLYTDVSDASPLGSYSSDIDSSVASPSTCSLLIWPARPWTSGMLPLIQINLTSQSQFQQLWSRYGVYTFSKEVYLSSWKKKHWHYILVTTTGSQADAGTLSLQFSKLWKRKTELSNLTQSLFLSHISQTVVLMATS